MPLANLRCPRCGLGHKVLVKRLYQLPKLLKELPHVCSQCLEKDGVESPMEWVPKPATSRVVESLDNGLMSRAVERPADAERLYKERADADNERRSGDKALS